MNGDGSTQRYVSTFRMYIKPQRESPAPGIGPGPTDTRTLTDTGKGEGEAVFAGRQEACGDALVQQQLKEGTMSALFLNVMSSVVCSSVKFLVPVMSTEAEH